jgi:hypothetical protein
MFGMRASGTNDETPFTEIVEVAGHTKCFLLGLPKMYRRRRSTASSPDFINV